MRNAWIIVLSGLLSLAFACIPQVPQRPTDSATIWAIPLRPESFLTLGEEFAFELADKDIRIINLESGDALTVDRSVACSPNRFHRTSPTLPTVNTGMSGGPSPASIKALGGGYWQLWGECEDSDEQALGQTLSRPQTVVMNKSGKVVFDLTDISASEYTWTIFWDGKFWRATDECLFEIESDSTVRRVGCSDTPAKYGGILWYRDRPVVAFESCSKLPERGLDCFPPETIQWNQALLFEAAKDFPVWEIKDSGSAIYFVSDAKSFALEDGELRRLPHRERAAASESGGKFKHRSLPSYMGRRVAPR